MEGAGGGLDRNSFTGGHGTAVGHPFHLILVRPDSNDQPASDQQGSQKSPSPAKLKASGDPERVRQVITNLVSNAIKFTHSGSVAICAEPVGDMVEVTVVDTGIGIPPDAQERIFQEFRQGDDNTSQRYGGTGLDLSIARKLVELQGGRMGVASEPGEGSCFWFTLPLSAGDTDSSTIGSHASLDYSLLAARVMVASIVLKLPRVKAPEHTHAAARPVWPDI